MKHFLVHDFALPGPHLIVNTSGSLGINYGMVADNLPTPAKVVSIIQSINISKARLYDANQLVLSTFRNTDISFVVAVANEDLGSLSTTKGSLSWIQENILPYYPATNIIGIVVGNEIFSGTDTTQMSQVLPGMMNIYNVLSSLGLEKKINVSTAHSFAVLSSSYPPSSGAFNPTIADTYIRPILHFLAQTGAPFMINAYPFFAYKADPTTISLAYVLFESNPGVLDPNSGLRYYNMFDAQLDSVYYAIAALGYQNLSLEVSETGWPSAGDTDEVGASIQNAQTYHNNLFQHLQSNAGTPLKPNKTMNVYIFALFNEDLKPGPTSERNYGLFYPDGTKVFNFSFKQTISSSGSLKRHWNLKLGYLLVVACLCLSLQ